MLETGSGMEVTVVEGTWCDCFGERWAVAS